MILNNFEMIKHHQVVEVPDDAKVFIIGDVHGQLDDLYALLEVAGFTYGKDYLFCCGDLIDRGTQNLEMVNAFDEEANWYTVLGNHDLFPITDAFNLWMMNGGAWAMQQKIIYEESNRYHVQHDFLMKLLKHPVLMTVKHRGKSYGLVHAGIPTRGGVATFIDNDWNFAIKALETFGTQALEQFVWDRDVISRAQGGWDMPPPIRNIDQVFSGHTVIDQPLMLENRNYLDLGGVFYKRYAIYCAEASDILTVDLN